MDDDLDYQLFLATYRTEAEENLGTIEEGLLDLEARPRLDDELLYTLMRAAHTLKGNSSSIGFQRLTDVTHTLEDTFERLRRGNLRVTTATVTALLGVVDGLRRMVQAAVDGEDATCPEGPKLLQALEAIGQAHEEGAVAADAAAVAGPDFSLEGAGGDAHHQAASVSTLRVDLGRLNRLLDLTGEVSIGWGRLNQLLADHSGRDTGLEGALWQLSHLHGEMQEEVMKLRLVPLGLTFRQYRRTVRDLSRTSGKQAVLVTEGDDVEVDASIADQIRDPITHMLRNAMDHGIESPEERSAARKPQTGRITLRASHRAGAVVIQIHDDGRGLDRARIAAKAVEKGIITDGAALTDTEVLQLIFEPGFSTARQVTELSGRGVGMDVVRRHIQALRGTVRVESEPGRGTTITLELPLTIAIIRGFSVGVGGETYVIPMESVVECVDYAPTAAARGTEPGIMNLRGRPLPYIHLREHFSLGGEAPRRSSMVLVGHDGRRLGLVVDQLVGETQAVIKPLNGMLQDVPGLAGSTILGSGKVALIVSVPALVERASGAPAAEIETNGAALAATIAAGTPAADWKGRHGT